MPAHRLQLAHKVPGASLIVFMKAWTKVERKKRSRHSGRGWESTPQVALIQRGGIPNPPGRSDQATDSSRNGGSLIEQLARKELSRHSVSNVVNRAISHSHREPK